ncbi:MAG: DoxX family protein [Bacteroidetes bacterium]|nr:DoxX family protein [Bacteroidota bacterium]
MNTLFLALSTLTGLFFLYYGLACLFSASMKAEFERFGVAHFRIVIGILELMGGVGLLVGLLVPLLGALAATGICLLMASVVVQRIQQGDSLAEMAPAGTFTVVALWLASYGYLNL